ncbi:MAG: hypothetical protein V3V96_10660 [Acidiferrobacterales bacterium]
MADFTINISVDTCAGGGHFDVSIDSPIGSFTYRAHKSELKEMPTNEELKDAAKVLVRLIARKIAGADHAALRAKLNGVQIALEPLP